MSKQQKQDNTKLASDVITIEDVIRKIGSQLDESGDYTNYIVTCLIDVPNLLSRLQKLNKGAFQSVVLRTIAILLDNKYSNHIKHCEYVWIINTIGGKIVKVPTHNISKNAWQYFAAFRTKEDAIYAVKILKQFKNIYAE